MDDYYSTLIEPAIDKLVDFVQKSIKNPKKNFDALIKFIEGKEIDEVIVMGVSLGEADDLYYSEILIPKFKNVKWVFMQHGEDDNLIRKFISKYSLSNIDIRRW